MLEEFWRWLSIQPPGAASFLGTVTGSFLGLCALLVGALFNAHLNRKRDDRLRRLEAEAVAAALKADLIQFEESLRRNAKRVLKDTVDSAKSDSVLLVPDIGQMMRIMPEVASKLTLLDRRTIGKVLTAYGKLEQYAQRLIMAARARSAGQCREAGLCTEERH